VPELLVTVMVYVAVPLGADCSREGTTGDRNVVLCTRAENSRARDERIGARAGIGHVEGSS
jgi:hypothetical protein